MTNSVQIPWAAEGGTFRASLNEAQLVDPHGGSPHSAHGPTHLVDGAVMWVDSALRLSCSKGGSKSAPFGRPFLFPAQVREHVPLFRP